MFSRLSPFSIFFYLFLTSLALSNNLIELLVSWVGLNISLYAIFMRNGLHLNIVETGLKYFIVGLLVTCLLFFSSIIYSIIYSSFSLLGFNYLISLNEVSHNGLLVHSINITQKFITILIVFSFLFKLGAYPFSFYVADVYENSTWKMLFMYTTPLKVVIFGTMLKLLVTFGTLGDVLLPVITWSALGSMLIGSFSAISETKLKRFWAYSYISSVGLILLGINYYNQGMGVCTYTAKVYFIVYLLTWQMVFGVLLNTKIWSTSIDRNLSMVYINDLRFLQYVSRSDYLGIIFAILSLMGLPPALGFFSKLIVYLNIFENQHVLFFILIILMSPISGYGYLRLLLPILSENKNLNVSIVKKNIQTSCGFFSSFGISCIILYIPFVFVVSPIVITWLKSVTLQSYGPYCTLNQHGLDLVIYEILTFLIEFYLRSATIAVSALNWIM